jgi:6-phosphogluconolactonase
VDWTRVALWWGDERFVAADSADRNDLGALDALIPALPLVEANLHRMPADDQVIDVENAAEIYATELGDTRFDICLLGVGPDGHVASLFPGHPAADADGTVTAVRDSPKPPPLRTSLTRSVINASAEVWFTVAGQDKAAAVRWAVLGERPVPAAQVRGRARSLWLLDEAAAAELPPELLPG